MEQHHDQSDLFNANMEVLDRFHPHVVALLDKPAPFPMEIRYDDPSIPNLYVGEGKEGMRALYPAPDPLKGIRSFVDSLSGLKGKIVAVFGFALGYYAFALWERYGGRNVFVIFEAIPGVIKLAMTVMDLRSMLSDPRVRIVVGDNLQLNQYLAGEEAVVLAHATPKHITFHPWTRLQEAWYAKAKEALERFIISKKGMVVTLKGSGGLFFKNRHHNLRTLSSAAPLNELRNRYAGKPAVIISSGPSLSKNIHQLRRIKNRALLVAADSALAPLSRNGLFPDFITSLDPNLFTYEKFFPFLGKLDQTQLICLPEITPPVLDYLRFSRIFYTCLGDNYRKTFNRLLGVDADFISHAQSVTHLALHGAQLMGCDPIIFVGLDLAYSGKKDHADGTVLHWGNNQPSESDYKVEDVHGRMVPTSVGFLNMLNSCEVLISNAPDRTYLDATEGGAKIGGTHITTLADVIAGLPDEELSVEEGGDAAYPSLSADTLLKNFKELRYQLVDRKNRIETYFDLTQKIDSFFKKKRCNFRSGSPYPSRVDEWIHRADRLNGEIDEDGLDGYLADLLSESNETYLEHGRRVFEAELGRNPEAIFFARYEKQKFLQEIRKKAATIALNEIEKQHADISVLEEAKKAVDADPENESLKLGFAVSLYESGNLAEAEIILEEFRGKEPRAAFLLGSVKVRQGRVAEGIALMEEASADGKIPSERKEEFFASVEKEWLDACAPDTPPAFRMLMLQRLLQLGTGYDDHRREKLRLVLAVADSLFAMNNTADAMALLDMALETQFGQNGDVMLQSARFLIKLERYDEGLARLEEAVRLDPAAAVLWEEIGDMLFVGKDYGGALTAYENCCNALPDRRDVFRKIGDCYTASGRLEAAMVAYQTAIKKD